MKFTLLELFAVVTLAAILTFTGKWMAESCRGIANSSYVFPWEEK